MNRAAKLYGAAYRKRRTWSFLAGVLYSLAFFKSELFIFGFIGMFLLFLRLFAVCGGGGFAPEKPFRTVLWFGFGFFVPLYSWLTALYPFEAFGFTPAQGIFVVIAGVFGIGAYHALLLALPFLLLNITPRKPLLLPLGAACCFMAGEWLMSVGVLAFPWGMSAVGQVAFLPLLQNAALFGARYITLVMCLFTAALSLLVRCRKRGLVIMTSLSIAIPLVTGTVLLCIPSPAEDGVRAAAVQGNELSMEKWDSDRLRENIERYIALTAQAAENGAELIVLPETAFPCVFGSELNKRITAITETYGCTVIVGALERAGGKEYNSVFAVYPDGTRSASYMKRKPVPFGEFLPYRDLLMKLLPFLESMNLSSLDVSAGESAVRIGYGDVGICALICFDSVFPSLAAPADLICVCTNDSWFKDTPGIYQHLAHSAVRAVENGKYAVRAANTGISCFISPKGVMTEKTVPLTQAVIYGTVYPNSRRTLYSYIGDIIMLLPAGFAAFCAALKLASAVKNRKKASDEA